MTDNPLRNPNQLTEQLEQSLTELDTNPDVILKTPRALFVKRTSQVDAKKAEKELNQEIWNHKRTPQGVREMLREFENQAGGRDKFQKILCYLPHDAQEELLMKMLGDPKLNHKSLAALAARCGFSAGRVIDFFRRAQKAEAFVKSFKGVYEKLPDLTGSVMTEALPRTVRCTLCDKGKLTNPINPATGKPAGGKRRNCNICEGRGYTIGRPEVDRQRLALEMSGVIQKGSGVTVNNQQNTAVVANMGTPQALFKSFLEASDKVLFGEQAEPAIDAEVIEEEA